MPATPPAPGLPALAPGEAFGAAVPGGDPLVSELAGVALEVAAGAAHLAAEAWGAHREDVGTKSSATDMVSEVDRAAEALISRLLSERRPDDGLLGEEGARRPGRSGVRWVVDPLDGTTNYLFGVPAWSVSVAAQLDGRTVVGVVADPARGEVWAAAAGRGAFRNGERCRVAEGRSELGTALVATGFGYDRRRRAQQAEVVAVLLPEVRDIRRFGSAALHLCWVAGARVDAYYEVGLNEWDLAAGMLICEEAGGCVAQLDGELVVASTPSLAGPLRALLLAAGAAVPT